MEASAVAVMVVDLRLLRPLRPLDAITVSMFCYTQLVAMFGLIFGVGESQAQAGAILMARSTEQIELYEIQKYLQCGLWFVVQLLLQQHKAHV